MTSVTTDPLLIRRAAHARGTAIPRVLRGPDADPRWARPALLAVLALTALLYMAGLSRNGWANDFYAAAVQAGTKSWKAFFFGSFDASNFITVDKTPASLWVMELSARVFGLNYWSVLIPQALEGVATAGVLYATVRRWSGPAAGIIAAGVMATTPVAALMFRFNNPDALLVLLMVVAAYAMTRAIDSGRTRWIALAGALLGFGFLTKMLQALLVLPAFALAYLIAGPPKRGRRIWQLLAGGAALVAAAGWWVAIVQLIPAADRPYIGGSTNNSVLQLALGYNGFGRLTGNETGSVGFGRAGGGGGAGGGGAFGGSTGLTRLFASDMGGQIGWLLPAALIALAALLWISRATARTDRTRAAALLWGGWLLVTAAVFSFMAGIIHPYYTVALAPAIGALVGIGAVTLWRAGRSQAPRNEALGDEALGSRALGSRALGSRASDSIIARAILAAGLAVTAIWAYVLLDRSPTWLPWLRPLILLCGFAASAAVLAAPSLVGRMTASRGRIALLALPIPLALVAALGAPLAYSINTAATAHSGAIPSAGPAVAAAGGPGGRAGLGGGGRFGGGGFAGAAPGGTGTGTRPTGGQAGTPPGATGTGTQAGTGRGTAGTGARGFPGTAAGRPTGQGGPGRGGGGLGGNTQVSSAMTRLLTGGAAGYQWVAATVGAESAAPFQLASGEPIMAIGGFNGTDQTPTLAAFEALVAAHKIHYFIGTNRGSFGGGSGTSTQITTWVAAHFTAKTVGGVTVYDLTSPTR
jgi:4-amino-4-deoxy-L-arabinose transferase-like glycosyltransferase